MLDGVHPLFQVKVDCICCGDTFLTSRVRPSFKKAKLAETDFYIHYKGINPEYYIVRVCSSCGFATTENFTQRLTGQQKEEYNARVRTKMSFKDFSGERTWEDALQTFQLALLCAQIKGEKERLVAGLLHHIAWLYRETGDQEKELRFLQYALDSYVKVYEGDDGELKNARLMYLIGELNRRLKNYYEAVKWFARVVNDKSIMDSAMIRSSREMWAHTRENMLADRMELPEEMKVKKQL